VKERDKWRTYERIVRGQLKVERGKSCGKKDKALVGIDGFSEENKS